METAGGSITLEQDGMNVEQVLFTYSEEEKQENSMNKINADLIWRPEFFTVDYAMLHSGFSLLETALYGFIKYFLKNNEKFYCSDKKLAEMFCVSENTIGNAIKTLKEKGLVDLSGKPKAKGGRIRFIHLVANNIPKHKICDSNISEAQNLGFPEAQNLGCIKNKYIEKYICDKNDYSFLFADYYGSSKGIDEKKCSKLIEDKLKQGITLEEIKQCMVLYNCECRIKQDFKYVKKLETWIKEFQPLSEEQIDEQLYVIIKQYRDKKKSDEKFANSKPAKTVWNDLKETFGDEKVKSILKQVNSINLTFT